MWIDERNGEVVCGPQPHARQQVVEQWGSDMHKLFRQAGLPRASAPADPCAGARPADEAAPLISSPLRGVTHTVRAGKPEPLVLRAEAAAGTEASYWFADDALIGRVRPGEGLAWMPGSRCPAAATCCVPSTMRGAPNRARRWLRLPPEALPTSLSVDHVFQSGAK